MGDGMHNWEFTAQRVREQADEFRRQDAEASGAPAHIEEMRKPHPMQEVIDAESVQVLLAGQALRDTRITDDEWDALVENAQRGSQGDWPETRQTLNTLGRPFGREVE